jgi:hypothetical protein
LREMAEVPFRLLAHVEIDGGLISGLHILHFLWAQLLDLSLRVVDQILSTLLGHSLVSVQEV